MLDRTFLSPRCTRAGTGCGRRGYPSVAGGRRRSTSRSKGGGETQPGMLAERGGGGPWRPEAGAGSPPAARGGPGTGGNAETPDARAAWKGHREVRRERQQEGGQRRAPGKWQLRKKSTGGRSRGTLLSQHSSHPGGTCGIPAAPRAPRPAAEGRARRRERCCSRTGWRRPLPHFTGKHWPPSPLTSVNIITPRGSELLPSLAAWQQP